MNSDAQRLKIAKKLILAGWALAIIGAFFVLLLRLNLIEYEHQIPIWIMPFFAGGSILLLGGALLGSRGVGVPLDVQRFFSLILGYPCWIGAVFYIALMVIIPYVAGIYE